MAQPPPLESMTGAQVGINYEHHMIHKGQMFSAHYEGATAGVGEEIAIGFNTPAAADGLVHMIIDVRGDDEGVWELREAPNITPDQGTSYDVLNRYRDSANASGVSTNETVPIVNQVSTYNVVEAAAGNLAAVGAVLHSETIAIAAGPPFASVVNAQSRGQREWILAAATDYVVIVTSSVIGAGNYEISLNFYEIPVTVYQRLPH